MKLINWLKLSLNSNLPTNNLTLKWIPDLVVRSQSLVLLFYSLLLFSWDLNLHILSSLMKLMLTLMLITLISLPFSSMNGSKRNWNSKTELKKFHKSFLFLTRTRLSPKLLHSLVLPQLLTIRKIMKSMRMIQLTFRWQRLSHWLRDTWVVPLSAWTWHNIKMPDYYTEEFWNWFEVL